MKFFLLTILSLLCLCKIQAEESFVINGVKILVPNPEGYVMVSKDMGVAYRLLTQSGDPLNDTLGYYIAEEEVPAVMSGKSPDLNRSFILKVNKNLRHMDIDLKGFRVMKETLKKENEKVFEDVKSRLPKMMDKFSDGVSNELDMKFAAEVLQMVPLAPHYETENVMSFSMFINYGVSSGNEREEGITVVTSNFLFLNNVVLFLYCNGLESDLKWTRQSSIKWVNAVIDRNADDEPVEYIYEPAYDNASPKGDGFDWGEVLEKTFLGALIGGGIGLLMMLLKPKD